MLTLVELLSRFKENPFKFEVVYPQNGTAARNHRDAVGFYVMVTQSDTSDT